MGGPAPADFVDAIAPLPAPFEEERAREAAAGLWGNGAASPALSRLRGLSDENAGVAGLLELVFGASPYLTRLVARDPETAVAIIERGPDAVLAETLGEAAGLAGAGALPEEDEMMVGLRHLKARAALVIALADLAGVWSLEQVTAALSDVADALVQAAVTWLFREGAERGVFRSQMDDPGGAGSAYVVIAMGKHGAHELNFSSDIDLIVLYDPMSAPLADGVEPQKTFVRLTRNLVRLLQEHTGEGYVYRVDLRLRPDPRATSVAIAIEAAAQYYENLGQNWERAAMIKARAIAGDKALGAEFLDRLTPFIWRKYLDYAAIADIHSIKRQIHAFKGHGQATVLGHNIKVGRGGIREIEFFVQTQQLIAGGRAPELRGRRTMAMLDGLAGHKWITREAAGELEEAYRFLRMVEHRLQMVDDEQTQLMPATQDGLDALARFAGFQDTADFTEMLTGHMRRVEEHYSALFEAAPSLGDEAGSLVFTGGEDDPDTIETLSQLGFESPEQIAALVRGWHFGRYAATRSARSRELLTELMPQLLKALASTAQPDRALIAFDSFLAGLPAGVQLFSLLKANPRLLDLLAAIMGTAPRLAELLAKRPRVLDAVLDADFFSPLPDQAAYRALIGEALHEARSYEEQLDGARIFGQDHAFRIGVRVLTGTVMAREAGHAYAAIAGAEIECLLDAVRAEIEAAHGKVAGGQVAVVAFGKLGGREMAANSDLDLMLIYDFDDDASGSDGAKPLAPGAYFSRLTQRLISALSAPTAEGTLYEVDMRLRPSGNQGPIATRLQSFTDYHRDSAWTWEKLALTRARVVAGDSGLAGRVREAIGAALTAERDAAAMARDVAAMRARIEREKPATGLWDLKQVRGGLVDIEFICQYLQIVHAGAHPEVLDQNTQDAFEKLGRAGILDADTAFELLAATRFLHALTQVLRLCVEGAIKVSDAPDELKALLQRVVDLPSFGRVEAELEQVLSRVKMVYEQLITAKC